MRKGLLSGYGEEYACKHCDEWFDEDDMKDGVCLNCLEENQCYWCGAYCSDLKQDPAGDWCCDECYDLYEE